VFPPHQLDPEAAGDHIDRLYRTALVMCGSRETAEDLVQETYGEPQPVPAEQPDVKAPELTLKGVPGELEMKDLKRGLKLKLTTDEPATVDGSLRAKARSVEFAKTSVVLAERSLDLGDGERKLILKPKRSVLRGAESLKAELRVTVADAAGNEATAKRKISIG
jgi:hypothetical protein